MKLVCAQFSIVGRVAWEVGNRAGLEFEGSLSLKHFPTPPVTGEQQPVEAVGPRLANDPTPPLSPLPPPPAECEEAPTDAGGGLAADVALVARLVQQLGAALAADAEVLSWHGIELQKVDIAVQLLDAIADTAAREEGDGAQLAALRASATGALRSGE